MADEAKNFAKVTVSIGYDASATSIALTSGHGARLPTVPFNVVWWNSTDYPDPTDDPNVEIVRVTARSTDTLTVTRAQEGTSASTKNTASKTYKMIAGATALLVNSGIAELSVTSQPSNGWLTLLQNYIVSSFGGTSAISFLTGGSWSSITNGGGYIEFAPSAAASASMYLPEVNASSIVNLRFSEVKRIVAKQSFISNSGSGRKGFGFCNTTVANIYAADSTAGARAQFLWTDATTLKCLTSDGAGTPTLTTVSSPPTGVWADYRIDYNAEAATPVCKFYINDVEVASHTTELPVNSDDVRYVHGTSASSNTYTTSPAVVSIKRA